MHIRIVADVNMGVFNVQVDFIVTYTFIRRDVTKELRFSQGLTNVSQQIYKNKKTHLEFIFFYYSIYIRFPNVVTTSLQCSAC